MQHLIVSSPGLKPIQVASPLCQKKKVLLLRSNLLKRRHSNQSRMRKSRLKRPKTRKSKLPKRRRRKVANRRRRKEAKTINYLRELTLTF